MIQSIQNALHSFAVWLVGLVGLGEACANYVYVLFISMVPIIELRGAMPAASILGLPFLPSLVVAIIGNLIPVPFILFFIKAVCGWMKKAEHLKKIPLYLEKKVEKNKEKVTKYGKWGLYLFVAIPLPGTGAWTGALIASFLNFKNKDSFIAIAGGVVTAGVIMTAISYLPRLIF